MIIIDATDLIAGRLASWVAKLALEGETIRIVNAEKTVISGRRNSTIKEFVKRINRGNALAGPFHPKRADRILKRIIRGMIPYKKERGAKAFKRIKTYLGVPSELKDKAKTIKEFQLNNSNIQRYITLQDLSRQLGGRA
ncbi:50S ribosomal protein L13 [archaeon]|nr:50S ribosomal protein L13 [archaeon]